MSHLSYEGQSELEYCVECALKHSQTAKVLMREALQRAEADNPQTEGVKEKVRGVVEELSGMEDDTKAEKNERVIQLNSAVREIRKYIFSTQAEIGGADLDSLKEIKQKLDGLVDETYEVREEEEPCPTCIIESSRGEEKKGGEQPIGSEVAEKRRKFIEAIRRDASLE